MRSKEEVSQSFAWVDSILGALYEAVIIIDENCKIVFINQAACALVERPRALLIGIHIWEALPMYKNDELLDEKYYKDAINYAEIATLNGPHILRIDNKLALIDLTVTPIPQFRQTVFVIRDDKRIQIMLEKEERKQAEIAKDQIHSVLESITDAFFALDTEARFTYINNHALSYFGEKSREELTGKSIWELFPELTKTKVFDEYQKAIHNGDVHTFEEYYPHPVNKWLEYRLYPSREGMSIYFRDVTDQKLSQIRTKVQYEITKILSEALDIKSALPQILSTIGKNFYWHWGAFWTPDHEKKSLLKLFECWTADESLNNFVKHCRRQKYPKGDGLLGRAWKRGDMLWIENIVNDESFRRREIAKDCNLKSGFFIPLQSGGELLGVMEFMGKEERPENREYIAFIHAITTQVASFIKRKQAEKEAKESEEHFRLLVSGAKDYVMVLFDPQGRIVSWNEGGERLLGYKEDEVIGKRIDILFIPEDRESKRMAAIVKRAITEGRSEDENFLVRKDGSMFWAGGITTPLWDEKGNLRGLVKVARDITERKELETRKDEFISMASHELKTPVTSVKVFTQILKRKLENYQDPDVPRFLEKMDLQLTKLTKLISDLLNLSKIQRGKLEFQWGDVNIDELVYDVVENLQATSEKHQIQVEGRTETIIQGDYDRLGQVIINLLTNAMKYSQNSDRIKVILSKTKKEVVVSVKDYGIGIDEEQKSKIFDRFYQVASTDGKSYPGLGIGLYISKEIAQKHGGDITVESKKGEGSTFSLHVPNVRGVKSKI